MYQKKSRRCCALMLTVSICLRVCMLLGLDARAAAWVSQAAQSTELARWMLFLETGQAAPTPDPEEETVPEPQLVVLQIQKAQPRPAQLEAEEEPEPEPSPEPSPEPEPTRRETLLPLALAEAEELSVAGACTYSYDKAALLARPSALDFSGDGPKILIVHTHGTEAYTPEPGWEYKSSASYHTLEADRSVIAVGDALAQALEERGIEVLHDRTLNDYPSFNDAYWTGLTKIEAWLEQYPGIQMVLDIHRDAVADTSGNAMALSSTQEGQSAAQVMLVVGTDQGGLSHPGWQENLANALKLQSVLQGQYPGLCRSLDLRTERFNQHATAGSLLVEVGTNGNTLRQALCTADLLGDALARMITALTQNGGVLTAQ